MAEFIKNFKREDVKKVEALDVKEIKDFLIQEIKGQDEAVEAWSRILQRILTDTPKLRKGPVAVLTEIGPSGVGKTEIAIQVARFLASHGKKGNGPEQPSLVRIDCGEYTREHEVSKILGSPPGYVGADITPRLAQSEIDKSAITLESGRKITILIFDEIEKAHEKLSVTLLAALDYGVITMGNNSKTNIEDCIVVFTSNLGNKAVIDQKKQGQLTATERKKIHIDAMLEHFTPEQLSRMGGETNTVCFNELSREVVTGILLANLDKLERLYSEHGRNFSFQVTPEGLESLLDLGYSAREGVRRLENILEQQVSARLAVVEKFQGSLPVVIDAENGEINMYIPKEQKVQEALGDIKIEPRKVETKNQPSALPTYGNVPNIHHRNFSAVEKIDIRAEILSQYNAYGASSAVNKANELIRRGAANKKEVNDFFYSSEMQTALVSDIRGQYNNYGATSAVNRARKHKQLGIMTDEGISNFFYSSEMQTALVSDIRGQYNTYGATSAVNRARQHKQLGIMTDEGISNFFYSSEMQTALASDIRGQYNTYGATSARNQADNYVRLGILEKSNAQTLLKQIGS